MAYGATALFLLCVRVFALKRVCLFVCVCVRCAMAFALLLRTAQHSIAQYVVVVAVCRIVVVNRCVGLLVMAG